MAGKLRDRLTSMQKKHTMAPSARQQAFAALTPRRENGSAMVKGGSV